ncbi:transcription initiation protein SPT3 homolog [Tetranychus urticae]|uniref:Transcription initiation protein SPT3 homolog n=1 Tax=Tetranychus urticae TaxID=32264 RepID=T1KYN1_TETUR|nr:transcription initiation protein SPT3 homolog [Tetranychus urticae]
MSSTTKLSITRWYTTEIQNIMHGFGDSSRPMAESAYLIEEVVHQQMSQLLYEVNNIANIRGSKIVGLEEVLFLMRKDKVKLARLLRYLSIKDLKGKTSKYNQDDNPDDIQSSDLPQLESKYQPSNQPQSKRIKLCYDFISSIDQTGELLSAFNEDFFDEIRHQRNLRMDRMTFNMTKAQYLRYSEARQANFANKEKPKRFKEWLLKNDSQDLKLNAYAWEIFQYLAYETVAEIVDIALLVKQDRQIQDNDPVSGLISSKMRNPDYPMFTVPSFSQKNATAQPKDAGDNDDDISGQSAKRMKIDTTESFATSNSITPCDIREALRRFNQPKGVFSVMEKCYTKSPRVLCL